MSARTEREAIELAQAEKILHLKRDVERLTAERDRAREECGHEKAMRASQREEMMRYFTDWQAAKSELEIQSQARIEATNRAAAAEASRVRVEVLCRQTGVISISKVRAALAGGASDG